MIQNESRSCSVDASLLQEDALKVIDIQTPNVSPSTQSVGSANSSGGAMDFFSNSPIVPINNQ